MSKLTSFINSDAVEDFLAALDASVSRGGNEYSYLGVNFKAGEISSIKLYYTFFSEPDADRPLPVPELEEAFSRYREFLSAFHITTPFVPGCGMTYCIKLDEAEGISSGLYFRVCCDTSKYINKFIQRVDAQGDLRADMFDQSGVLKYLSYSSRHGIRERSYIYCDHCAGVDMFDQAAGVAFSSSDCLEISTDWDEPSLADNMKFIAISKANLANADVTDELSGVERLLRQDGILHGRCFSLHGYYLHKAVRSAFFFSAEPGKRSPLPTRLALPR